MAGSAKLKIPAGTQNGQRFRLKQLGLHQTGGARGDLYVVIGIDIPTDLDAEKKKLWERLAELA